LSLIDLLIGVLLNNYIAHTASFGLATTTHGTRFLNKLTFQGDYTMTDLTVSDTCSKVNAITDQGISETKIEGVIEFLITAFDQVIKTQAAIRSLKWLFSLLTIALSDFIKTNEFSATNLVLSEESNTLLTILNVVNDNMIEDSTSCCYGTIVFLIDSSQVS
jgi:hypothetical protein